MKQTKNIILATLLTFSSLGASKLVTPDILNPDKTTHSTTNIHSTFKRTGPTIQIAILLDTSNSMDGLIEFCIVKRA